VSVARYERGSPYRTDYREVSHSGFLIKKSSYSYTFLIGEDSRQFSWRRMYSWGFLAFVIETDCFLVEVYAEAEETG
jgi:hypothetical protein